MSLAVLLSLARCVISLTFYFINPWVCRVANQSKVQHTCLCHFWHELTLTNHIGKFFVPPVVNSHCVDPNHILTRSDKVTTGGYFQGLVLTVQKATLIGCKIGRCHGCHCSCYAIVCHSNQVSSHGNDSRGG